MTDGRNIHLDAGRTGRALGKRTLIVNLEIWVWEEHGAMSLPLPLRPQLRDFSASRMVSSVARVCLGPARN